MNSFTYSEIICNSKRKLWNINNLKQQEYIDVNKTFDEKQYVIPLSSLIC